MTRKENKEDDTAPRLLGRKEFAFSALAIGACAFLGTQDQAQASGTIPAYLDTAQTFTADQTFAGRAMFKGGDPWFDVMAFGALGNNTHDDTANIQAAIDAAAAVHWGGTVFLPPGIYSVAGTLNLKTFVRLVGSGIGSTIVRSTSTTLDIIAATGAAGTNLQLIEVRDLQIDSSVTRSAGSGIAFHNVNQYRIKNVRFVDTYNICTMTGDNTANGAAWIEDIRVATKGGKINAGFYFQYCTETHLNGVSIEGGSVALGVGQAWFQFDSNNDTVEMKNVRVSYDTPGVGGGVALYLSKIKPGFASRWVRISNFHFSGGPAGGSSPIQDVVKIDDGLSVYFNNGYAGDGVTGLTIQAGIDLRFSNVLVGNLLKHGVITYSTVTDVTFDGCTISNVGKLTSNTYYGFYVAANIRAILSNCHFGNEVWNNTPLMKYAVCNASNQTVALNCTFAAGSYATIPISAATLVPEGFYGPGPAPSVTGSRGGNAALQALLQSLATAGLIVNNTTA